MVTGWPWHANRTVVAVCAELLGTTELGCYNATVARIRRDVLKVEIKSNTPSGDAIAVMGSVAFTPFGKVPRL